MGIILGDHFPFSSLVVIIILKLGCVLKSLIVIRLIHELLLKLKLEVLFRSTQRQALRRLGGKILHSLRFSSVIIWHFWLEFQFGLGIINQNSILTSFIWCKWLIWEHFVNIIEKLFWLILFFFLVLNVLFIVNLHITKIHNKESGIIEFVKCLI